MTAAQIILTSILAECAAAITILLWVWAGDTLMDRRDQCHTQRGGHH